MKQSSSMLFVLLVAMGLVFVGCDDDDDEPEPRADGGAPYIYLYPEVAGTVSVTLEPIEGTWLTSSIPEYGDGWTVWAEPSGRLDGEYDYLYYSARVYWDFQFEHGWSVAAEGVFPWFEQVLPRLGLNSDETRDFVDYWSVHLPYSPCYRVFPQGTEMVDRQIAMTVIPEPDSVLRLWLAIERLVQCEPLPEPELAPFDRKGFTVVEWGVVMQGKW